MLSNWYTNNLIMNFLQREKRKRKRKLPLKRKRTSPTIPALLTLEQLYLFRSTTAIKRRAAAIAPPIVIRVFVTALPTIAPSPVKIEGSIQILYSNYQNIKLSNYQNTNYIFFTLTFNYKCI